MLDKQKQLNNKSLDKATGGLSSFNEGEIKERLYLLDSSEVTEILQGMPHQLSQTEEIIRDALHPSNFYAAMNALLDEVKKDNDNYNYLKKTLDELYD